MPQSNAPTSRHFGQVSGQTGRKPARSISWKAAEGRGAAEQGSFGSEQEGPRGCCRGRAGAGAARRDPPWASGCAPWRQRPAELLTHRPRSQPCAPGLSPASSGPAAEKNFFFNHIFSFYVFLAFSGADGKEEGRVYCRQMMCPWCDANRSAAGSTSPAAAMPPRRRGCSGPATGPARPRHRPGPATGPQVPPRGHREPDPHGRLSYRALHRPAPAGTGDRIGSIKRALGWPPPVLFVPWPSVYGSSKTKAALTEN